MNGTAFFLHSRSLCTMNFDRRKFVQLGMGAALSFHWNRLLAQGYQITLPSPCRGPRLPGVPSTPISWTSLLRRACARR